MRSCTYIHSNTAHCSSLSNRSSPWAYHTETMPLPVPPSSRLPKPTSAGDCRPGYTPFHAFPNHSQRVTAAVSAIRTLQPCDDDIRSRYKINPRSTHFVLDSTPSIRPHSTQPHSSPFALPPTPTRSQPPGLWHVEAYGFDGNRQ